jgi:hypothetical protein
VDQKLVFPGGDRYEGPLKSGRPHGYGKCERVDRSVYVGQFR